MKKLFSLIVLFSALLIAQTSFAQLHFTEDFSYPAGDSIGAHGWVYNTGTVNPLLVSSPGLTFTGYPSSGIGNALTVRSTGNDAYKNFTSNDSTGSVYCAFMVRVDTAKATGDYFLAMISSTSTTNYAARVYAKDSLGFVAFGISKGTAASGQGFSAPIYIKGTTYLLVSKYTFNPSTGDDVVSLYVFAGAMPTVEPPVATVGPVTSTAGDSPNLGRVAIRQGSSTLAPTSVVDGIRVAEQWSNISAIVNISTTVPDKFLLSQNYPNPFNPNTKINFALPVSGYVSLKVYNSIGKEVSTLVNERLNTGTYSVDFIGSNLNSGAYFYRLELSGENGKVFTEQKKLMLVK